MDFGSANSEGRFSTYAEGLVSVIGHADRARPLRDYCVRLLMPVPSIFPMLPLISILCERQKYNRLARLTD